MEYHDRNCEMQCILTVIGFEVQGLDHIPNIGPAMIIYYHGVLPVDMYYVIAKCILVKGRMIHAVGDRFLFKIPGELLNRFILHKF